MRTGETAPEGDGTPPRFTIDEVTRSIDRRRGLRRTPRLTVDALRVVWQSAPRHTMGLVVLQLLSGLGVSAQLLIARRLLQELVDVSRGAPTSSLYVPLTGFVLVSAVMVVLGACASMQQRLLGELVARHAFDRIVLVGSSVEYRLLETPGFYDQLQRAQASGDFRLFDMVNAVIQLMSAAFASLAIAAVLALLSPVLLLFVCLAAAPVLYAAVLNSGATYAFEYAMTPESRERAYVLSLLTSRAAAKEVRLLGLGRHLRQRYRRLTDERLRQLRLFLWTRLRVSLAGGLASAAGTAIALVALLLLLQHGKIDVPSALTAGLAMQQLARRLSAMTSAVARLIESGMFIDDYQSFVALTSPEVSAQADEESPRTAPTRLGRLAVENVTFTYPQAGAPAIDDVSLHVENGEIVALVGINGSGKTTLVKLISQLYAPETGRITWDGEVPNPEDAQAGMTVLFQDYLHYHLTALDNITFGRVERTADVEHAREAARHAGADGFLDRLPQGYETRLGLEFEGGQELSVGQWQRLALARAFFRGGDFLILDEPTAALDPKAEAELFAQIRQLSEGRSVLLISHRFSSVRSADRIYVLDEGRIIEAGTHEELLERAGHYAELFNLQAAAYMEHAHDAT